MRLYVIQDAELVQIEIGDALQIGE